MSTQAAPPATPNTAPKAKKKKQKKRGGGIKADSKDEPLAVNGTADVAADDEAEEGDDVATPIVEEASRSAREPRESPDDESSLPQYTSEAVRPVGNGTTHLPEVDSRNNGLPLRSTGDISPGLTQVRLQALARERDELKAEVTQLRQSLESITSQHDEELSSLNEELEQSRGERDQAETQYQNLLGKVNTIRSQLGERLKSDAAELSQARSHIEVLEEHNRQLQDAQRESATALSQLQEENEKQAQEIHDLRVRTNLSQANWDKERQDLITREAQGRERFEAARQSMQDWEVLAAEERSLREQLSDKMAEVEEQLVSQKDAYERAARDRDNQSQTVEGLQRALRDVQDARKKELRELVENSQSQLEELRKKLQTAEEVSTAAKTELEATQKELSRAMPFEEQVREKNLLIGKLRHEAVILNDHLTKALRFLKQRKPEDTVDRHLVTNHFLHFLALDRSDPKKFQILQLIAALLSWSDEQKEKAGLSRPGAIIATGSLRLPQSPFRRTPSTPSLSSSAVGDPVAFEPTSATTKESLAELWSDFLERESQEGTGGASSRKDSSATMPRSGAGPASGLGLQ